MAAPLQLGFTDYEQTYAKKKTRRQRFLDEMEATVPWDAFLALILPVYHRPSASWRPSEWCKSPGPQPGIAGLSVRTSGDRLHG